LSLHMSSVVTVAQVMRSELISQAVCNYVGFIEWIKYGA
jgi:hypothetical protein